MHEVLLYLGVNGYGKQEAGWQFELHQTRGLLSHKTKQHPQDQDSQLVDLLL